MRVLSPVSTNTIHPISNIKSNTPQNKTCNMTDLVTRKSISTTVQSSPSYVYPSISLSVTDQTSSSHKQP